MMKVYAAMHNPCTYESVGGVLSLHSTKRGAWMAAREARWNTFVDERKYSIGKGRTYIEDWQWWGVKEYEVEGESS